MKILKESFMKESYGPITLKSKELYDDYGYDIEGDTGRFAQSTSKDGIEFDLVTDISNNDTQVTYFPSDSDEYFYVKGVSSESQVSSLLNELEGMTMDEARRKYDSKFNESSKKEDTVKTKDGKWTNKGKEGTHGEFNTKKQADAQRRAMFANGFKG